MRAMKRCAGVTRGVLVVAGLAMGCGAEAPVSPTGRSMTAPAQAEGEASAEAPRIEKVSLVPSSPRPGTEVAARVETSSTGGSAVALQYLWAIDGRRIPDRSSRIVVPESARKGATIEVSVVAADGATTSEPVTATGQVGNRPPGLIGVRLAPGDIVGVGEEVVAIAEGRDADGDPIEFSYSWRVNGAVQEATQERFSTHGLQRGDEIVVRVRATDGEEETPPLDSTPLRVGNSAPAIVSTPVGVNSEGIFRYVVEAQDPDGDRNLRFRLLAGPEGATIDPLLGEVVWTASVSSVGVHPFEIEVDDGHGGRTQQRFDVTVRELQRDPLASDLAADTSSPASME